MATTTRKLSAAVVSRALKAGGMRKTERAASRQFAGFEAHQDGGAVTVSWVNGSLIRTADHSAEMMAKAAEILRGKGYAVEVGTVGLIERTVLKVTKIEEA